MHLSLHSIVLVGDRSPGPPATLAGPAALHRPPAASGNCCGPSSPSGAADTAACHLTCSEPELALRRGLRLKVEPGWLMITLMSGR